MLKNYPKYKYYLVLFGGKPQNGKAQNHEANQKSGVLGTQHHEGIPKKQRHQQALSGLATPAFRAPRGPR